MKSTDATIKKKLEADLQRTNLVAGDAAPSNSINDLNYNLESAKIQRRTINNK